MSAHKIQCINRQCKRRCARKKFKGGGMEKWKGGDHCSGWVPLIKSTQEKTR